MLFDIETAPLITYAWALGMENWNPGMIRRDWFVLCWSAKWYGEKRIYRSALPDFRGYKELPTRTEEDPKIDKGVMKELWTMLDECDIAIAHNLKAFDRKKANTRFIVNGMSPPSHYDLIDTLTVARSQFKFTSNKLGYLADKLGVPHKLDAGGFDTWDNIERGYRKDWKHMIKYCDGDIAPLDGIYEKMIPWIPKHPYNVCIDDVTDCDNKGCKGKGTVKDGIRRRSNGVFQKRRCRGCGIALQGEKINV